MRIDNSALELFRRCPSLYYERIVLGLVPTGISSAPLAFGSVVHKGLATIFRGGTLEEGIVTMEEAWEGDQPGEYRTIGNAIRLLTAWDKEWTGTRTPFFLNGEPLVEKPLVFPTGHFVIACTDDCNHCGYCKEEIEFGGIMDVVLETPMAAIPMDHKTTSQLGDTYYDQYTPNSQMTGYYWLTTQLLPSQRVSGPMINAMCLTRGSKITIERPHLLSRTRYQVEKWMEGVVETCNAIKRCERSGVWARHENACTTKYGNCMFKFLHSLPDLEAEIGVREQNFTQEPWDFLKMGEKV